MDMGQVRRRSVQIQAHRSSARSKDGCVTCKRRKVKCDEQRPRCSHCERLNFECKWQPSPSARHLSQSQRARTVGPTTANASTGQDNSSSEARTSPYCISDLAADPTVNQVFDYASFMWDGGGGGGGNDAWQPTASDVGFYSQILASNMESESSIEAPTASPNMLSSMHDQRDVGIAPSEPSVLSETSPPVPQTQDAGSGYDNYRLMDYFIQAVTPPILSEVETQKQWFAMRQVLVKMANSSRMVRWAVLAFSSLMLSRQDSAWIANPQNHYDNAATEVASYDNNDMALGKHSLDRENLLAALFFLGYVDILEARIEAAHSHLKRAYRIFQHGPKESFVALEKQFFLWLRLLDARTVSAGGEGLFLSQDDESLLVQSPPSVNLSAGAAVSATQDHPEGDIEDVLFQILYQPGILFFQKVQSFMGRISQIDPWHRSRGTVEDETEVMNLGAAIATDLRSLYEQRPLLMDHAVTGRLTAPHISAHLASVITRSFRTYLANYYASKIHLHRVAYKMFPLTKEATEAVAQIRELTRLVAEGLDVEDALPINMLWPLLMLGSEDQDIGEREWIRTQILRMERVAGNARITARVLEEVQARQDKAKTRVDIRSVMHDIYNQSFAIV
ncbi:fungal-specific transcription factor domain-containing protein [Apiospora arundinis]